MPNIKFPYGKKELEYFIPDDRFNGQLVSKLYSYKPDFSENDIVRRALLNPIGTPKLSIMAKDKKNIVILASDHTRPVPSKIIIPEMLKEIRELNKNANITILVSTGCHRNTTKDELIAKFGEKIVNEEKIMIHDCDNSDFVNIGKLPSGGDLIINKLAYEADLLVSEGFIEPHFFAGFSGGRKSIFPGVTNRKSAIFSILSLSKGGRLFFSMSHKKESETPKCSASLSSVTFFDLRSSFK